MLGASRHAFRGAEGRVSVPTGCGASGAIRPGGTPVNTTTAAARQDAETQYNIVRFTTIATSVIPRAREPTWLTTFVLLSRPRLS